MFNKFSKLSFTVSALELLKTAIGKAGYSDKVVIGMDVAASEFYRDGKYDLDFKSPDDPSRYISPDQLADLYKGFVKNYPCKFQSSRLILVADSKGWLLKEELRCRSKAVSFLEVVMGNTCLKAACTLKFLLSLCSGVHWRPFWPGWLGCLEEVHCQCWHPGGWWWSDSDQPKAYCQGCGGEILQLPAPEGQPDWLCDRVSASVSSPFSYHARVRDPVLHKELYSWGGWAKSSGIEIWWGICEGMNNCELRILASKPVPARPPNHMGMSDTRCKHM